MDNLVKWNKYVALHSYPNLSTILINLDYQVRVRIKDEVDDILCITKFSINGCCIVNAYIVSFNKRRSSHILIIAVL